jgi:putative ABC transport system ATP-binding protein
VIEFRDVRRLFVQGGRTIAALDGVTLAIAPGEFVALTGPSGSGKSTLIHLAAGLDRPSEGTVRVAETDLASLGEPALTLFRRRTVGLVFQFFNLVPTLTVEENVALPLLLDGLTLAKARPRAQALAARVGLSERLGHLPDQLSGGELQRTAIARAVAADPPILLADEPTGNLDSANGAAVLELLASLRSPTRAILLATHDTRAAARADRRVGLRDGRIE